MGRERGEKVARVIVPALDEILGQEFKVLDDGFVRAVDYMGGDDSVVQAARVSYGKGTLKRSDDEGLIRYLMRHAHTTPTEMCEIKFHVRVPMDCWRQWIRHRMASVNEYSTRYSEAIDEKQTTPPGEWRQQSDTNKQGSSGTFVTVWPEPAEKHHLEYQRTTGKSPGDWLSEKEAAFHQSATELYKERLRFNVAREVARKDLPLSTYTEAYWKIDLHNLLHFLSLRMDGHAQKEIRDYANVIGNEIVARWCPLTWAAFNDYNFRRDGLLMSGRDKAVLRAINGADKGKAKQLMQKFGWLNEDGTPNKKNREYGDFVKRAAEIGISV